jgi:molybdenum cofactor cytidylyltransferase
VICAVVLAAGLSSRMGVQKLLLPFGGKKVISHIIDQLLASLIDEVHVVVGHNAEQISTELSGRAVSIVNNPDYKSGMLSSVRCGLKSLPEKCRAAMVVLGDQPSITTKLIDRMLKSFTATEKDILVPLYKGKRGHPILFSVKYRDEIMTHYDDVGLRGLMHEHSEEVLELEVPTASVLYDMDYPEDYRRELDLNDPDHPQNLRF